MPKSTGCSKRDRERGERLIWLPRAVLDRPNRLHGPAESYSDVIVKLVETEGACGL